MWIQLFKRLVTHQFKYDWSAWHDCVGKEGYDEVNVIFVKAVGGMNYDSVQLSCCMQSWQEDADIRSQLSVEAHNFM